MTRTWEVAAVEVGVLPQLPLCLYIDDASAQERIDIPCYAYVLHNHDQVVVVDTGFNLQRLATSGRHVVGNPEVRLITALRLLDATPGDVSLVVHTHLHYDHAQNDHLFNRAEIVVQREELDHALSSGAGDFYDGVADLVAEAGHRLRLLDGETELLEGIRTLPNGGHTPGHQSVLVDTEHAAVCLCGDILSLRANVAGATGPICPDVHAATTFAQRVRSEGWDALPGHEPDVRGHRCYLKLGVLAEAER